MSMDHRYILASCALKVPEDIGQSERRICQSRWLFESRLQKIKSQSSAKEEGQLSILGRPPLTTTAFHLHPCH